MAITAGELITTYQLEPHPEGGFFKESYRTEGKIGKHSICTAIYFLLPRGSRSRLHRIKSDELWHFYLGGPMTVFEITPEGRVIETVMGTDFKAGQKPQHVVPAGRWFGSYPNQGTDFSFVGCTVSPGFDYADFEIGEREALLKQFPDAEKAILALT